jgi:membrane protein YqaA with SNARE-associated domain
MELGTEWMAWGLPGLFLASFLAATVLPFSSEAVLLAMAVAGADALTLFGVATLGNSLGGLTNYGIGRWLPSDRFIRWARIDASKAQRWMALVQRRGTWTALLCWLPVIGDPIAIALGVCRAPLPLTALFMVIGKAARYAVLLWAAGLIWPG